MSLRAADWAPRSGASIPLQEIWQTFLSRRTAYLVLVGAFALLVMHGHGSGTWIPAFFARKFGWEPGRIGAAYGAVVLLFGTSGAAGWARCERLAVADRSPTRTCSRFSPDARSRRRSRCSSRLAPTPETSLVLLAGAELLRRFSFAGGLRARSRA